MTKIVLKKSEVLKSDRPVIVQPLEEKLNTGSYSSFVPQSLYSSQNYDLDTLLKMDDDTHILEKPDVKVSHNDRKLSEDEKKAIIEEAKKEAEAIINQANQQKNAILQQAEENKVAILTEAQQESENIKNTTILEQEEIKKSSHKEGYDAAYSQSETENKRLITLLQKISVDLVAEKDKILTTVESEIVDLILMISSKVVKSITSQYKQVVLDNVIESIKKLKIKNDLIIKVNPDDLYTVQEHKAHILEAINGIDNIQFLEDPSIELGGCVIQSQFGSVDGRISSQLAEIEEQIRKISPIRPL